MGDFHTFKQLLHTICSTFHNAGFIQCGKGTSQWIRFLCLAQIIQVPGETFMPHHQVPQDILGIPIGVYFSAEVLWVNKESQEFFDHLVHQYELFLKGEQIFGSHGRTPFISLGF